MDLKKINTTALAYLGDAVYEVYVREASVRRNPVNIDAVHRSNIKYVRAEGQELAVRELQDELTPEEASLVRRARNHKITSSPRKVNPMTYKMATAFEALIGYLYLSGDKDRLEYIIEKAFDIIDSSGDAAKQPRGKETK